jgi:hypothetical protein
MVVDYSGPDTGGRKIRCPSVEALAPPEIKPSKWGLEVYRIKPTNVVPDIKGTGTLIGSASNVPVIIFYDSNAFRKVRPTCHPCYSFPCAVVFRHRYTAFRACLQTLQITPESMLEAPSFMYMHACLTLAFACYSTYQEHQMIGTHGFSTGLSRSPRLANTHSVARQMTGEYPHVPSASMYAQRERERAVSRSIHRTCMREYCSRSCPKHSYVFIFSFCIFVGCSN